MNRKPTPQKNEPVLQNQSTMQETEEEEKEKEKKRKLRKTSFRKGKKIRKYSNGSPCLYVLRHGLKKEEGSKGKMTGKTGKQDEWALGKHPLNLRI